jgi:hypothetical protein
MARTVIVAFGCVAILAAGIDDSIAAATVTTDDDYAAALDNEYLLHEPAAPQMVERQLRVVARCGSISISEGTSKRAAAAAIAAHLRSLPRDVSPLIMRC